MDDKYLPFSTSQKSFAREEFIPKKKQPSL
jgi:hypothetical protein